MLHRRLTSCCLVLTLAACSSDPNIPPGNPGVKKDAAGGHDDAMTSGPTDGGPNADAMMGNLDATMGNLDATMGNPDATMGNADATMGNPDAMMGGQCNPVTGGECPGAGEVCYYVANDMDLRCRLPIGMPLKQHEEECSLGTQDCAAGFSCISFAPGMNPTCLKGCSTGADCSTLMGASAMYGCNIETADMKAKFCIPQGAGCDPLMATGCGMGQYCEYGASGAMCMNEGTANKGDPCMPGQCKQGHVCINIGAGGHCEEVCDPMIANDCSAMGACASLQNVPFGICQPPCDPYLQNCPNGGNCTLVSQTAVGCVPAGPTPPGGMCGTPQTGCAQGGHCINFGSGGQCYTGCDMTHACPAMGMCAMTNPPLPFGGVCM